MIYLDTSCLVKLIRIEAESELVAEAVSRESQVFISSLTELEALIELKAGYLAGEYTMAQWRRLEVRVSALRNDEPFIFKAVPGAVWQTAFRQHRNSGTIHCRTLDRLHLAALEHLQLNRLITHDDGQAKAAEAQRFEVIRPGR